MIKLEMHCHTLYGSDCAHETAKTLVSVYKKNAYGGIVLTNHMCKMFFDKYKGTTDREKIEFYLNLYHDFVKEAKIVDIKPFLGTEVRAKDYEGYFTEYLLYGISEDFLLNNIPLFNYTQKELFEICEKNHIFMSESHPFRKGVKVGYYEYLNAVEVFNGHIFHTNNNNVAEAFANAFNLKKTSGTDFHDICQKPNGGIYIPENINTNRELADYLFLGDYKIIKGDY